MLAFWLSSVPPLLQLSDSVTLTSPPTEKILITVKNSGRETGPNTEPLTHTTKTAPSLSPTHGREPSSALSHGSAEVPDSVRDPDGAQDTMDVKELPCPTKLQDLPQTTEQYELFIRQLDLKIL